MLQLSLHTKHQGALLTQTKDNQSWEELTKQEDEYFEQLEKEIQVKEEESAQWWHHI